MDEFLYEVTWLVRTDGEYGRILFLGGSGGPEPSRTWGCFTAERVIIETQTFEVKGKDGPYRVGSGAVAAIVRTKPDGAGDYYLTTDPNDTSKDNLGEVSSTDRNPCS